MKIFSNHKPNSERGVILIFFVIILVCALAMTALVIDLSQETLALETLQRAADAAALGGARELDSSLDGWIKAKKAAVVALKSNYIHGTLPKAISQIALNKNPTTANFWDNQESSIHPGTEGSVEGFTFSFERGSLWFDRTLNHGEGGYSFRSLEITPNGRWMGITPTYLIANAVKIKVKIDSLPTFFAPIVGIKSFDDLETEAIAVSDSNLEFDVAPLAIPYCELLLDIDVSRATGDHLKTSYDSKEQQKRTLLFTEANPKRNLRNWNGTIPKEWPERRDGLTRFESFIRPTYTNYSYEEGGGLCSSEAFNGPAHSCKNLPLYATIGKPSKVPGEVVTPNTVGSLFSAAAGGRLKTTLGQYFAPLESLKDNSGASVQSAAPQIAAFLRSGISFFQAFSYNENFPFIRTYRPKTGDPERRPKEFADLPFYDLDISYPTRLKLAGSEQDVRVFLRLDYQSNPKEDKILAKYFKQEQGKVQTTRKAGTWSNPLCHGGRYGIKGNDPNQKVRRTKAMVVAPSRINNRRSDYCDFAAVFSGQWQNAIPPVHDSYPTIVGAVDVLLYDFNVDNLDNDPVFKKELNDFKKDPSGYGPGSNYEKLFGPKNIVQTVTPNYPGVISPVVDRHQAELDSRSDQILKTASERLKAFQQAREQCRCDHIECRNPDICSTFTGSELTNCLAEIKKCEEEKGNCIAACQKEIEKINRDDSLRITNGGLFPMSFFWCFNMKDIIEQLLKVDNSLKNCFYKMEADKIGACLSQHEVNFEKLFAALNEHMTKENGGKGENIRAKPFSHCLPSLNYGAFNKNSPDSYRELQPLHAGYGCGGILGRVAGSVDGSAVLWASGNSKLQASPALIKEDR